MPRLLIEPPGESPRIIDVHDGLTVGRSEGVDIILLDTEVSRQHLRFSLGSDGECSVTSLSSSHGTLVNGKPIDVRELNDGDVIQVGGVRIKFIDPEEASVVVQLKDVDPVAELAATNNEAARRLRVFYDIARAIRRPGDLDARLGALLEAIIDVLGCERGAIGLHDQSSPPDYIRRIIRARGGKDPGPIVISRTLIDATVSRRQGIIASDAGRGKTLVEQKILSAMGVPLLIGSRVLGFIYVDDRGSAYRFLEKDLDFLGALAHLTAAAIEEAREYKRAFTAAVVLSTQLPLDELIGDGPAMRRLKGEIQQFAPSSSAHVLIQGETGTGKELVARTLHALSPRAGMPLVVLNCATLPDTMIESELFGFVKGAFTGAVSDKHGRFFYADEGTLFLDEIGDLSLVAQAKVLRAVQHGEVQPLGSGKTLRVDVRILAATHKDLAAEVLAGRFREDLYYRLTVLELVVPPLRERPEDIPRLAQALLMEAAKREHKNVAGISPQAVAALCAYRFPGNVRELENEVQRAAIMVSGGRQGDKAAIVDIGDLSTRIRGARAERGAPAIQSPPRSLAERYGDLETQEAALVAEALRESDKNISEAARLLGISRSIIKGRMKRFGLGDGEPD